MRSILGCGGLVISSFTGRKSIATAIIFIGYASLRDSSTALIEVVDGDRTKNILALFSPIRVCSAKWPRNSSAPTTRICPGIPDFIGNSTLRLRLSVSSLIGILIMVWRYVPED